MTGWGFYEFRRFVAVGGTTVGGRGAGLSHAELALVYFHLRKCAYLIHLLRREVVSPVAWEEALRLRPGLLEDLLLGYGIDGDAAGTGTGTVTVTLSSSVVVSDLATIPPPLGTPPLSGRRAQQRAESERRETAALREQWRLIRREAAPPIQRHPQPAFPLPPLSTTTTTTTTTTTGGGAEGNERREQRRRRKKWSLPLRIPRIR